ncbi:penicillin-binding [Fusarium albosuccineum]|uniref:Penicillin-binding n=1 Tax=Fusarium albosuccineum TaxID=1237068 RepID=A0A8H4PB07_9HYPO|nr:penicillin-binding [Fusarium albosuccineum]
MTLKRETTSVKGESPLNDEFGKFVEATLDEWKVPGFSLAVIDDDKILTACLLLTYPIKSYGTATFPDTPATAETLWYGASTTKAFTAAVLAQLIDSKKYPALENGWQTTISSILREDFVLQDEWATNHLTLEDAACHRTGMPRHDQATSRYLPDESDQGNQDGAKDKKKRYATVKDVTRNLRNLPLSAEPRVKFQYCNAMYSVLSHVIETVTGKPLGHVMKELIFEPLGMSSTYFSLDDARAAPEHLATGYYWDEDTGKFVKVDDMPVVEVGGGGAIISNVQDYAKWAKCMLRQEAPFSEDVHKELRTPRIVQEMPKNAKDVSMYGLGWDRTLYHGHVMYTHGGGMHAFGSSVVWFPDDKFGIVAFGNTSLTSNAVADIVLYRLIDDRLGIAPDKRTDFGKDWRETMEKFIGEYNKAIDIVYPDRPDTPVPSPASIKDLAGTYYDPGYKTIELRVEPHPDKQGEPILAADRMDSTWQIQMRLQHVSSTWWILRAWQPGSPQLFREFAQVEFKLGVDGKPTALVVDFYARLGGQHEGKVVFNRVGD